MIFGKFSLNKEKGVQLKEVEEKETKTIEEEEEQGPWKFKCVCGVISTFYYGNEAPYKMVEVIEH